MLRHRTVTPFAYASLTSVREEQKNKTLRNGDDLIAGEDNPSIYREGGELDCKTSPLAPFCACHALGIIIGNGQSGSFGAERLASKSLDYGTHSLSPQFF